MKVIGVSGKARAGKDSIARFFTDQGYRRLAFADPIKDLCRRFFFLEAQEDTADKKPWERELLQRVGTEHGRDFWRDLYQRHPELQERLVSLGITQGQNLWVAHLERTLQELEASADPPVGVVIPDVRFTNEARFLQSRGASLIRVERPGVGLDGTGAGHRSEVDLDTYPSWDYVFRNDGTLEELMEVLQVAQQRWAFERQPKPRRVSVSIARSRTRPPSQSREEAA